MHNRRMLDQKRNLRNQLAEVGRTTMGNSMSNGGKVGNTLYLGWKRPEFFGKVELT